MWAMLETAAPLLRALPTGETRRYDYHVWPIVEDLVAQGALDVTKPGEWRSLHDLSRYRVPRGMRLNGERALILGEVDLCGGVADRGHHPGADRPT